MKPALKKKREDCDMMSVLLLILCLLLVVRMRFQTECFSSADLQEKRKNFIFLSNRSYVRSPPGIWTPQDSTQLQQALNTYDKASTHDQALENIVKRIRT